MSIDRNPATIIERQPALLWIPRLFLAAMFIESAIDKLLHFPFYVTEAAAQGVPLASAALVAAIAVEIGGSLALIGGILLVPALLSLAVYVLSVNLFYFDFWNMTDVAAVIARKEFLKNVAVAGGLIAWLLLMLNTLKTQVQA